MRVGLFLIAVLINLNIWSQNSGDYPLDIPIILSSSFGELRPNHFHAGIDIKTKGVEGFKIYSIGDGYISRLQITHGGNGKAIYIKHDNGQSSVYAHLQKYSPRIEKIVKEIQYTNQSYTFRNYPKKNEFRISSKEMIGLTGNTGRSTAPHLHYELRDEKDRPINPMKFKSYSVNDTISPILLGVFYKNFRIDNKGAFQYDQSGFSKLKIKKINSSLYIADTLKTNGFISFGVNSYDKMNNTQNKMGLSKIISKNNGKTIFEIDFNKFSFDEWHHINNFIDYSTYKKSNFRIQKLFIEDSNPLSMYKRGLGNGIIEIKNEDLTSIYNIKLYDYNDNLTEVLIPITAIEKSFDEGKKIDSKDIVKINNDSTYTFDLNNSSIHISKNTFYHNTAIEIYNKEEILHVDQDTIPLLKPITIKFDVKRYNESMKDRMFVAKIDEKNDYSFISNKRDNDKIIAKIKTLGDYKIKLDTIPPSIKILNLEDNQWVSNLKKLKVYISDKSSGIKSYNGWINDQWILLEYNPSKGLLTYDFDDNINSSNNRNNLSIIIEDNAGNISELNKVFYREIK